MDPRDILVLQLETFPAVCMSNEIAMSKGLTRYRKELVKAGSYFKAATGQAFAVTSDTIDHWVHTFNRWIGNGNAVPIPLGHAAVNEPEKNQGWVHMMWRENDTLVAVMELLDEKLALTTDVSICVQGEVVDGKGRKYKQPITHVALCTDPVIPGLGKFEKLSLSKGDTIMDKKVLATLLGIAEDAPDELITSTIEGLKKPAQTIAASQSIGVVTVDPLLAKVVAENRAGKLSTLVNAQLITPAVKDLIDKRYVESAALTLSLSKGGDDGFDLLVEVLTHNKPGDLLDEKTGMQVLELANTRQTQPNVVQLDVNRRRAAVGMKN